jgi:hypothetical protein
VGVGVEVGVLVGVTVGVAVEVNVLVAVNVRVGVGLAVAVNVGRLQRAALCTSKLCEAFWVARSAAPCALRPAKFRLELAVATAARISTTSSASQF